MKTYFYLKPKDYPRGEYDVVTRGSAPDDEAARALAEPGEIVCGVVEQQTAYRDDQETLTRMKAQALKDDVAAVPLG